MSDYQARSCVYYMGDGQLVKIGTTVHSVLGRQRASRPSPGVLLAVEPGGEALENYRHRQFSSYAAGGVRDRFRLEGMLAWHILTLPPLILAGHLWPGLAPLIAASPEASSGLLDKCQRAALAGDVPAMDVSLVDF